MRDTQKNANGCPPPPPPSRFCENIHPQGICRDNKYLQLIAALSPDHRQEKGVVIIQIIAPIIWRDW